MADRTLEKITVVPTEDRRGFRLALSWMTGGSGREAEMLPDVHATEEDATEKARVDYGVEPDPGDATVDRRP